VSCVSGAPRRCKGCGASIYWIEFASGKRHPINSTPDASGSIACVDGTWRVLRRSDPAPAGLRYVSHFATCPAASAYRGGAR